MTIDEARVAVLYFWRYHRQCPLVALEASCLLDSFSDGGRADVLVVSAQGFLVETEIKLSIIDLRRDKKKLKHRCLGKDWDKRWVTSRFYFAVPCELIEKACPVCEELYPYAGILGIYGPFQVQVLRRAKRRDVKRLSMLMLARMAREQSGTVYRLARKVTELEVQLRDQGG